MTRHLGDRVINILVITNSYPNAQKPYAGFYIKRHKWLHEQNGLNITILAPDNSRRGRLAVAWKYLKLSGQVVQAILSNQFDVIHAHWPFPSGFLAMMVSWLRQKPFILTSHGAFVDNFSSQPWLVRFCVKLALRKADSVIAVSENHRQNVAAISGLPYEGIKQIHMGIWLETPPLAPQEARTQLNLEANGNIIVYIGDLLFHKGPDLLLKAASILLQRGCHFQVFMGGQGAAEESLKMMADELNLTATVHFLGAVAPERVPVWLAAADVCVVPSRMESLGLVALEAMACGTAVIAARVGGLGENISHEENGFLFPVGDAPALADCLSRVLDDVEQREQVAAQGHRTVGVHDMRLQAAQVEHLYYELANHAKIGSNN